MLLYDKSSSRKLGSLFTATASWAQGGGEGRGREGEVSQGVCVIVYYIG